MKLSYRWLCALLGQDPGVERAVEALTNAGLEVEGVADLGAMSGKVIAARILTRNPHPNADKLSLCDVDAGDGGAPRRIVCGAQNMGPGDVVPLAVEGAQLPGGFTIKKSKIRGEASEGMMCSGRELGLGEDHSGLLLLPTEANEGPYGKTWYPVGTPFEAIIEIKVTANRGDCLSILGVAREVAASLALAQPASLPALTVGPETAGASGPCPVPVEVADAAGCPRYLGRVLRGVKIGPSPRWLVRALEGAGLRSINNVVDVTNFILLETGQPLHAFDLKSLRGGRIVVRSANEGEVTKTLDGTEVTLRASDLVIADAEGPVALAGIMGGANSEITEGTSDVFLECASFDPIRIRQTAKRLGISTDSSYRFERGTDRSALDAIVDRAARLILAVAGGTTDGGVANVSAPAAPALVVVLPVAKAVSLLGTPLTAEEAAAPLRALGFGVEQEGETLHVAVPGHRTDIALAEDLIEEIARIRGYDKIPSSPPPIQSRPFVAPRLKQAADRMRAVLVRHGFFEAMNYSFTSQESLDRCSCGEGAVALRNPLSAEFAVMRTSLFPGLLESVGRNQNHGRPNVRLFEVGSVYIATNGADNLPPTTEAVQLAAALVGSADATGWRGTPRAADFHALSAVVEELLAAFGVVKYEIARAEAGAMGLPLDLLHPGKSAIARADGRTLATWGEIHPVAQDRVDLRKPVLLLHIQLDAWLPLLDRTVLCTPISQFPAIERDLALVVPTSVAAQEVAALIRKRGGALLSSLRLFDVYEGTGVPDGHRSLAYALRFQAEDRTLRDEEIEEAIGRILTDLKGKLGAELRSA